MRGTSLSALLLAVACSCSNPQRESASSSPSDSGSQLRDGRASGDGGEADAPPDSSGEPRDAAQDPADGAAGDAAEPPGDAFAPTDAGGDGGSDAEGGVEEHLCPLVDMCGSHQGVACPALPPAGECTSRKSCFYCQGAATRPSIEASCVSGRWSWSVPQPCAN